MAGMRMKKKWRNQRRRNEMNKFKDLVYYALIKEAFTDENGKMRLKASNSIRALVNGNSILRQIFHFPRYMEEKDILAVVRESPDVEAFTESLRPLHLAGQLQRSNKSALVILSTGEEISVKITPKTMFEANIAEGQQVHAFCEKDDKHTVKTVVSNELFEMLSFYCRDFELLTALSDFLSLDAQSQQTVKKVMCDKKTTRSTLLFLSYMASRSADGCDLSTEEAIETSVEDFNKRYAPMNGYPVCFDDILCVLEITEIRELLLPQRKFFGWALNKFFQFLVIYSVIHGVSPWSYNNRTIAQVLCEKMPSGSIQALAECLPHLTDPNTYHSIMNETLENSKSQVHQLTNWEDLLFESLCVSPFEQAYLFRALDTLFEDSIAEYQVPGMKSLISGPNGPDAKKYLFDKFVERFNAGEAAYHYAAAAVLNVEALERGSSPLAEAVESAILPFSQDELLLSIARVGLIVWTQLGEQKQLFYDGAVSGAFKEALLKQLRCYDKRLFCTTASTVLDLMLAGWLQQEVINEDQIFQTAIARLKEDDGRMWTGRLIAFFPRDDTRMIPDDVSDLCHKCMTKMEKALRGEDEEHEPEIYFGILCNLGWWKNRTCEKIAAWHKIACFYQKETDETQRRCLRLLQKQL